MKGMHSELQEFLTFGECGVMFYDNEKDKLFTLSVEENNDEYLPSRKIERKNIGGDESRVEVSDMRDMMLTEKQIIWFPSSVGITGQVFKSKVIHVANNPKKYGQEPEK